MQSLASQSSTPRPGERGLGGGRGGLLDMLLITGFSTELALEFVRSLLSHEYAIRDYPRKISKASWLDANGPCRITQQLVVFGQTYLG
ncbi:uncharacterized protein PADG_11973 [Paracoccidioides brasiliensis Pb18]|uniref:Uncharacterized protein n=1 Tax=Paracoccidioides brasiliensis (strain Pb18) TaxID=502780 RepID=A0A0A0HUY8_PARBD|nr:uncharacterized protein PADG_11973 [Paracoccidioides brasiliensis Pb18]KGM91836.1 hypothetical protein PADG_11973 [Paracoccidioides brasiliensis Pb18]